MPSFSHDILPQPERGTPVRPNFSSRITSDRLRECERQRRPLFAPGGKLKPQRRSVFREEGLDDLSCSVHQGGPDIDLRTASDEARGKENVLTERRRAENTQKRDGEGDGDGDGDGNGNGSGNGNGNENGPQQQQPWYAKIAIGTRPVLRSSATAPAGSFSSISRVALIAVFIAVMVPGLRYSGGRDGLIVAGADAGIIRSAQLVDNAATIEGRADSPTDVCTRWAHQIANVNGTVYMYGGRAKTESGQTANTWNNNFLTLDLTKTWTRDAPVLAGLPQPSGPPAVAMGALWHSQSSLFLYGGQFSDTPPESPLPVSTWEYEIGAGTWKEWENPQTSAGNHSEAGGQAVQRSAEGAGISVPELGKSWYFGGHLDLYTTQGWSNQIARVYLKSLLEFTHPGYANSGVESLGTTKAAPNGGVYRNITAGGLQDEAGFTERADGALVYIPGWGTEGIILGLAGGTNQTFTEMNTIDIYDIANSTWYKQATSGSYPEMRVNPCVGVVAAPDGTSFQVHLFGGQNLIPFGSQIQYSDMWILTIPSFVWIQVNMDKQSVPYPRAGHQCTMWDGQMVVIGGYVGTEISCDSPGIYVFNASSLQWQNEFVSLSPGSDSRSGSAEESEDPGFSILRASRGYQVPAIVQAIIGGNAEGGATATSPAVGAATAGPIATGKPPTFTVTRPGSIVTQTARPDGSSKAGSGTNTGAVVAGVIAGLLAILAGYLAFCTWLYRKQVGLYKNHIAMAQRASFTNSPDNEIWSSEVGSGDAAGAKGVVLGPFGTDIGGSGTTMSASAGRSSMGSEPAPGAEDGSAYGRGATPDAHDGRTNDDERAYTDHVGPNSYGMLGEGAEAAHSSVDDLLGGQEPSFFSVVWNPRRTLRVVNLD